MGAYLDNYGAGEEKRERIIHKVAAWTGIILAVALVSWFTLYFVIPNRAEQSQVERFFQVLAAKDYTTAYAMWGCTDANPCRSYPMKSFLEDWGPGVVTVTADDFTVLSGESCGSGVIVDVDAGKAGDKKIWVERADHMLGFLPPQISEINRCPQGNRIYDFVRDLKYRLRGRRYE